MLKVFFTVCWYSWNWFWCLCWVPLWIWDWEHSDWIWDFDYSSDAGNIILEGLKWIKFCKVWDFNSDVDGGRPGGFWEILVPIYQNTKLLYPVYLPMGFFLFFWLRELIVCSVVMFCRNWVWFRNSLCAYLKGNMVLVPFERKVGLPWVDGVVLHYLYWWPTLKHEDSLPSLC